MKEVDMKNITIAIALILTLKAHAHGDDKPGPHGGFITMPGAFHVEVVPRSKQHLDVYLLDAEWKNPTVKESSVTIRYGDTAAKCEVKTEFYECLFPKTVDLTKSGNLSVDATREKQKGNTAVYKLPLKQQKH
jgi:hypothetical protein